MFSEFVTSIGANSDVDVDSYSSQVSVGETIQIPGESTTRQVTTVHSPSTLKYRVRWIDWSFWICCSANVTDGSVTGLTITSGGLGYPRNTNLEPMRWN